MCTAGSIPIPITGDQFVPQGVEHRSYLVTANDVPTGLSGFVDRVRGKSVVKANYTNGTAALVKEVYFDLSGVLADRADDENEFLESLKRAAYHSVPARINRVICADDSDSKDLADLVLHYSGIDRTSVQIVDYQTIAGELKAHVSDTGASLVVAGVVATGSTLLGISQVLRHIQSNACFNYFIGLARMRNEAGTRELKSNLGYGKRPGEHGVYIAESVCLPTYKGRKVTPWDEEAEFLRHLAERDNSATAQEQIGQRVADLRRAQSSEVRGLETNLFWGKPAGGELEIRPGFAFVDFDYSTKLLSQAEVYLVVLATMHRLRTVSRGGNPPPFSQQVHARGILSPKVFERYNDGAIQAAFLRAARSSELDYSLSKDDALQMQHVLKVIFDNAKGEAGEASTEFLLALAMGRLRIGNAAISELRLRYKDSDIDIHRALWSCVT